VSLFYTILYRIGFTPWEEGLAQDSVAAQINALFEREECGRKPPYGRALDLGCGSGIHAVELAKRGWQVTGIDIVPEALKRAHKRARLAGQSLNLIQGDVTRLRDTGVGRDFRLILDFGTVHGLPMEKCRQVGAQVSAVANRDASLLVLAFEPGRRMLLPGGLNREQIGAIYPDWEITDDLSQDADLPPLLRYTRANPRWYRLRRRDERPIQECRRGLSGPA